MTAFSKPPDHFIGSTCELGWFFGTVLGRMPFLGQFRVFASKIIESGEDLTAATDWTPFGIFPFRDGGLPFVTVFAFPPDYLVGSACKINRFFGTVLGRMPFLGQFGIFTGKVIESLESLLS